MAKLPDHISLDIHGTVEGGEPILLGTFHFPLAVTGESNVVDHVVYDVRVDFQKVKEALSEAFALIAWEVKQVDGEK